MDFLVPNGCKIANSKQLKNKSMGMYVEHHHLNIMDIAKQTNKTDPR
jgi:hypothetical protein